MKDALKTEEEPTTLVSQTDLAILIRLFIDFSLGKKRFAASISSGIFYRYQNHLTEYQIVEIKKSIMYALQLADSAGGPLGDEKSHLVWLKLKEHLLTQEEKNLL